MKDSIRNVWVVMAAYNESSRIGQTLQSLNELSNGPSPRTGLPPISTVVVDDGSVDDTIEIARKHASWVLRHPINCGQGAALQTGIDFALSRNASAIVTLDADGQHDPADLPVMLQPVLDGSCDVVLGSRFLGDTIDIPPVRRYMLGAATWFTRRTSGLRISDTHNGFRVLSRQAAMSIRIQQPRMAHASEILDQIAARGLRYTERPVTIRYTTATLAKGQKTSDAVRVLGQLLAGRIWK